MANKVAIIGSAAVLLVAVVAIVAVTVSSNHSTAAAEGAKSDTDLSTSSKSIQSLCAPTDYRQRCESTLNQVGNNVTDPKQLIELAFNITISHIKEAFSHSKTLKDAASDPLTKEDLASCQEMLDYSIDDLRRSVTRLGDVNMAEVDSAVADLQSWLSASYTYLDLCLDDFQNKTSPAAVEMSKALNASMELADNANAIVNQLKDVFKDFHIPFLMDSNDTSIPEFVTPTVRRLLAVPTSQLSPSVTVAADGSGQFKTITDALKTVPHKNTQPFVIHIKAGTYKEKLYIGKNMTHVVLVGDGPTKTIITYGANYGRDGTKTSHTATVAVEGFNFMARDIGFENSAGPEGHQAVALRISADCAVVYNCRMDGYQDTLYVQTYRQFFRDCTITGTIDFIFGAADAILQNCEILVRKPLPNQQNMVTAQGRGSKQLHTSGLVLHNCTIKPDPSFAPFAATTKTFLGRPWREFARTVFLQSDIDGFINPEGYTPWIDRGKIVHIDTCIYEEFGNRGAGAECPGG